jgi:serine/threonine protein phosphatase PrpC
MTDDATPAPEPAGPAPALAWGAATDTGRVRTENEDAFVAEPMVFGVADGMGGHQAGEVASAIAAGTLRDRLGRGAQSVDVAVATVVEANAAIFQGAHSNPAQRGMGTTLTAMVVLAGSGPQRRLALLNVGDSRTYVMRGGVLRRVTIDHSYVQELVSTGHITEYEARSHPRRNIVTRALGIEPNVRVDTWVLPFVAGDRYVLCSDGLVDEVDDLEIAELLLTNPGPQAAAEALVDAANGHGGRDNVTVVVVDVLEGDAVPSDAVGLGADREGGSDVGRHDRLIDAESAAGEDPLPMPSTGPATAVLPVMTADAPRARFGLGTLLFGITLGLIAMLTIVLILVVRNNAGSDPDPTTPTSTTTTTSTSTNASTTAPTTAPTTVVSTVAPTTPTTSGG